MTRSQIVAVLIAVGIAVAGLSYAWRQGMFPHPATSAAPTASSVPVPAAPSPASAPSSNSASGASSAPAPAPPPTTTATPSAPAVESAQTSPMQSSAPPAQAAQSSSPSSAPPQPHVAAREAAPAPALQALPPPVQPGPDIPAFDTVRVEPSGDTVVAGHGAPDAKFALVSGDKVLSEVEGDGAGNFVMVPPPLAPGNYLLALRSTAKDGTTLDSHQNIAVSVPPKGQKNVVIALAEPGKPSVILTDTQNKPAPNPPTPGAAPPPPRVAFKTAEVDKGGFYASGTATAGAHLRIYLNGTFLTDVTAGPDGHWSLTVGKGMTPGHFAVRADMIDDTGKVLARAEVPFEVPAAVAEADAPPSPQPQVPRVAEASRAPQPPPAAAQPAAAPPQVAPPPEAPRTPQSSPAAALPPGPARPASSEAGERQVAAAPPRASVTDAVVPQIQTTTVVRGDSLWRISRKVFGRGIRYTLIYEANAKQIRDPSLIYPGQVFVLPHIIN